MNGIKVKFWGVRGSFPIPKSEDAFGGNTSCIEIRTSSNELVVLDMGTGLKNLGNSLIKSKNPITDINIVLSHFHYDHILGFLMFMPLFDEKYTINIYAPGESDNEVILSSSQDNPSYSNWNRIYLIVICLQNY